jgi:hypothetical protein
MHALAQMEDMITMLPVLLAHILGQDNNLAQYAPLESIVLKQM